jgi:hypothetical protein
MGRDEQEEPEEPTPELNVDLLKRVIKRIERDEEMWDQESWGMMPERHTIDLGITEFRTPGGVKAMGIEVSDILLSEKDLCGTTFCCAGHTVLEAGDTILIHYQDLEASYCVDGGDKVHVISQRARELLGLTDEQADFLFAPGAGAGDIATYKKNITDVTGVEFD